MATVGVRRENGHKTATPRRALIVGGSMSGLLAGMMLARRGWQVEVFERAGEELSGRGAGIVAQSELIARLTALGLDVEALGVKVTTRQLIDATGRIAATVTCPQVLTAWERVYRILRDAFPAAHYHRGRGLKAFEQDTAGVRAVFNDGGDAEGDVLIGADGLRSTVRQHCLPDVAPVYAGYVAWRALLAESALSAGDPPRAVRGDDVLPAARRTVPRLSGRRPRQRSAGRAIAVITSCGTARRTRRTGCGGFSPTSAASPTLSPFRRRSSLAPRSPRCAMRRSSCWRRNCAPSCD